MRLSKVLLFVIAIQTPVAGWCQGQRLKLEGAWDGRTFEVSRVKERDPGKDIRTIRVAGSVAQISHSDRRVQIGPVRLRWQPDQETQFSGMAVGDAVQFDALQITADSFVITRIDNAQMDSGQSLELIGALTGFSSDDDWTNVYLAGIPARVPKRLFSHGRMRLQRLDDRRPDSQFTTSIAGIRTTIGGELGLKTNGDGNRDLDKHSDDTRLKSEEELQLEAFFEFSDRLSGFAEIKAQHAGRYDASVSGGRHESALKRGELWLFVDQPFGLPVGLQIGRQNFAEQREWWWNTDLDAIRVYLGNRKFQLQVAIAEELGRDVLGGDRGDAEDLDVSRLFATARMRMSRAMTVELFVLRQNDHSTAFTASEVIAAEQEDEDDSDLLWIGTRLSGSADFLDRVEADYWFDFARVNGTETRYEFDEFGASELLVESVVLQDRSGTGFDLGLSLSWPDAQWFGLSAPSITFGYAGGSGDGSSGGTFRQTGLQHNNSKFNGVDRFRYYGELTRADLENIRISTVSLGFRLAEESSIELIHHNYQQQHAAAAHALRLDIDANGRAGNLGNEIDLLVGIEPWKHFEFEAVAAYFRAGSAFDTQGSAWSLAFKLDYNF